MKERMELRGTLRQIYIGLVLFILSLLPRILGLNVFATPDVRRWVDRSVNFFIALLNGDWTGTLQTGHPGVTTMWTGTVGLMIKYLTSPGKVFDKASLLEFLQGVPIQPVDADYLFAMRLPTVLLTSACVVAIYFLVRRLFGDEAAFLSSILVAFDPFYLAHSRFLHHDALGTSFMTLALLSFMVCTEKGMSWPYLIFSGLTAGLAFLSKSLSLFLVPFVGLVVALAYLSQAKSFSKGKWGTGSRWIAALLLWGLIASFVFVILWPAMWVDPAEAINKVVRKIGESGPVSPSTLGYDFLAGKVTPALFYPTVLLFRLTPLTLVGLMVAVYSCTKKWPERENKLLILLSVYSLGFILLVTSGGKKADRYSLPAFPVLDVVAAVGLLQAIRLARQKESWPFTVPCALALVLQAGLSLPHHPYYLTYYNPLFGGGRSAVKVLPVGWGEGLDQAARYLNRKENSERLTVSTGWDDALAPFFTGQTWRLYGSTDQNVLLWATADYVVLDINQIQRHLHDEPLVRYLLSLKPEYVVNLKGIDYEWIYPVPKDIPDDAVPAQHVRRAQFNDSLLFLGYDVIEVGGKDGKVRLNLYWQCLRKMEESYRMYLKLINGVYHVWGEQDGLPLSNSYPTNQWEKSNVVRDRREIEILPATPPGFYQIVIRLYDPDRDEWLSPLGQDELLIGPVELPRREPPAIEALDMEHPLEADLGDKVRFLGYSLESGLRPGDNTHLTLFWQAQARMDEDYTVFTHLVDESGRMWGQKDNEPVDGFYPTSTWQPGEIVRDQYDLPIAPDAPPGRYTIRVGMYRAQTGERLPVSPGQPEGEIVLSPVYVEG